MENSQLSNVVFGTGFSLSIIAIILDWQSSKDFIYYGLYEANPLAAKNGFFDTKKNLLYSGAFVALITICGIVASSARGFIGVMFIVPIVTRGGLGWLRNIPAKKKGREKQIVFLRRLREMVLQEEGDDERIRQYFSTLISSQSGGATYYKLFGWMQSRKSDYEEAITEVRQDLINLAQMDEKDWFPK